MNIKESIVDGKYVVTARDGERTATLTKDDKTYRSVALVDFAVRLKTANEARALLAPVVSSEPMPEPPPTGPSAPSHSDQFIAAHYVFSGQQWSPNQLRTLSDRTPSLRINGIRGDEVIPDDESALTFEVEERHTAQYNVSLVDYDTRFTMEATIVINGAQHRFGQRSEPLGLPMRSVVDIPEQLLVEARAELRVAISRRLAELVGAAASDQFQRVGYYDAPHINYREAAREAGRRHAERVQAASDEIVYNALSGLVVIDDLMRPQGPG